MNDLDELAQLRNQIPFPERSRLAPGRSRLLSAATQTSRQPLPSRRRWPLILPPAAAVAAAAAAVIYVVVPHSAMPAQVNGPMVPATAAKPAASAHARTHATLDARRVLDAAASAVAARAATAAEPSPGQWIYARTVDYELGQGTTRYDNWITFDGSQSAYYADGQLIVHKSASGGRVAPGSPLAAFWANSTPKTAYDALASLPADPRQLLTVIGESAAAIGAQDIAAGDPVAGGAPKTRAQLDFDLLTLLLWNAAGGLGAPPAAEAAAYHALALLPGVTVREGVRDAAGVPAIAVSADGGYSQLLLDKVSYQVLGLRLLSTGIAPDPARPARARAPEGPVAKGAVQESLAYARVAEVSSPGDRG